MKFLLLISLSLSSFAAFANAASSPEAAGICSAFYANRLKAKIMRIEGKSDKFRHCALSCQFALRCGPVDSAAIGIVKELVDMVTPGNAEWDDLRADLVGVRFFLSKMTINDEECVQRCDEVDWDNF